MVTDSAPPSLGVGIDAILYTIDMFTSSEFGGCFLWGISLVTWSDSGPLERIWLLRSLDEHSITRE